MQFSGQPAFKPGAENKPAIIAVDDDAMDI